MKLTDFKALTFDCYGTLIDWETGIAQALQPLTRLRGESLERDRVLEDFAQAESRQQAETPQMLYPGILALVHQELERKWGVEAPASMRESFAASVGQWPAFPDSAAALKHLAQHFKLIVLSNVDRAGFQASRARLGIEFDAVYTAQDIGSYKPDERNFHFLLKRASNEFGLSKSEILHTAQSIFHDHLPATRLGLSTAWIDRRADQAGWGATMQPSSMPDTDFRFNSMADLAASHRRELSRDD